MCWPCNGQEQCLSVSGIKPSLSQHLRSRDLAERIISCRKRQSPVVLVAPAAFKGTHGPRQVAEALSTGIRRALPEASLLQCPISDGGDGLLDAVLGPGSLREKVAVRPAGSAGERRTRLGRPGDGDLRECHGMRH